MWDSWSSLEIWRLSECERDISSIIPSNYPSAAKKNRTHAYLTLVFFRHVDSGTCYFAIFGPFLRYALITDCIPFSSTKIAVVLWVLWSRFPQWVPGKFRRSSRDRAKSPKSSQITKTRSDPKKIHKCQKKTGFEIEKIYFVWQFNKTPRNGARSQILGPGVPARARQPVSTAMIHLSRAFGCFEEKEKFT